MAYRKFLTSVPDVYAYDDADNLVFIGKTLSNSSIEATLGSTPVRGGKGNQLQYTYFHTGELKFTIEDTQWNLGMLAATVGSDIDSGNYYAQEGVTVSATGSAVVSGCPLAFESGKPLVGWATDQATGATYKVTISTSGSFTLPTNAPKSQAYCVRYFAKNNTAGNQFTIPAKSVPKIVKLVLDYQLNSSDITSNKIGSVQVIVPRGQLSGAFTINMAGDGVATTPIEATALAYTPSTPEEIAACGGQPIYARVVEHIVNTTWADNVVDMVIAGGDISLPVGATTYVSAFAVTNQNYSFKLAAPSQVTFTSSASAVASITTAGKLVALTSGSTTITAQSVGITPSYTATMKVTVR